MSYCKVPRSLISISCEARTITDDGINTTEIVWQQAAMTSIVNDYLQSFLTPESIKEQEEWGRVKCCNASRSLYCTECFTLLIPDRSAPPEVPKLPFDLHIILHDKRKVATGIHAKVLDRHNQVTLMDIERGDPIPDYSQKHSVYLLFPSNDAIPLCTILQDNDTNIVHTLVVLDCTWTQSSVRDHPYLACLPKVHLSNPAPFSNYWRWHVAGPPGMLCTMEAIYEAAVEVDNGSALTFLPWLWLFGIQRRCAVSHADESAKQRQYNLRRTKGTDKHAKDKERGKVLKMQVKREREAGMMQIEARKPMWMALLNTSSSPPTHEE